MKLYKFRPLGNCIDFERVEQIIVDGKFWCSKLWDLNDPMEGVYRRTSFKRYQSEKVFSEKNRFYICSFSGEKGFKNPILWGYYANGFKGVAIEIEVSKKMVEHMEYVNKLEVEQKIKDAKELAKIIITRKLDNWNHEDEWRFLKYKENPEGTILDEGVFNIQKIGKVENIYFGDPYNDLVNNIAIIRNSKFIKKYHNYRNKLKEICGNHGKKCYIVNYESNKIHKRLFE
jgi:hypothetical protein